MLKLRLRQYLMKDIHERYSRRGSTEKALDLPTGFIEVTLLNLLVLRFGLPLLNEIVHRFGPLGNLLTNHVKD